MAADTAITAREAINALYPLFGAGGLTAIIVAVVGYLTAVREGKPKGTLAGSAQVGIATLYADQASLIEVGKSFKAVAASIDDLTAQLKEFDGTKADKLIEEFKSKSEDMIDEFRKLRRSIEDAARPN